MKNQSRAQSRTCPRCGKEIKTGELMGRVINIACDCEMEAWRRVEEDRKVQEIEKHLRSAGFETGKYSDYRFENWKSSKATKQAEESVYGYTDTAGEKGRNWLYLCGDYGTGKTHMAVSAARQLAYERNWKPEICRWVEYCSMIQASWRESVGIRWGMMHRARLLVLDDIDKRAATEWAIGQLFELIEHRYVHERPTIITANRKLSELAGWWSYDQRVSDAGKAVISRIVGMIHGQVEFKGGDYRMKK